MLVLDEVKEAFANLYSTAISAQNLIPGLDRRIVAAVVGAGATAVGLLIDLTQYESYLYLIGSVFVPLFGVFAVSYYVLQRGCVGRLRIGPRPLGDDPAVAGRVRVLPAGEPGGGVVVEGAVAGVDAAFMAVGDARLAARLGLRGAGGRGDHPAAGGRATPTRCGASSGTLRTQVRSPSPEVS